MSRSIGLTRAQETELPNTIKLAYVESGERLQAGRWVGGEAAGGHEPARDEAPIEAAPS